MNRLPVFEFDNQTSTGLTKVTLRSLVLIEDSDGTGKPKLIYINDKTGITPATTINDLFLMPELWYEIGASGGGGSSELELITENGQTGWRLLGRDPLKYADIGQGAVDFSNPSDDDNILLGATGLNSFASGLATTASGHSGYAEGYKTTSSGDYGDHAEGYETTASGGYGDHAEGYGTIASGGYGAHAEGYQTEASAYSAHASGGYTTASGDYATAIGYETTASGDYGAHAEGYGTTADGDYGSHAEGYQTNALGEGAHAEGYQTYAVGDYSHAEGAGYADDDAYGSLGENSHSEGYGTTASGQNSHSEGDLTQANGDNSHAEGDGSEANGRSSHAEGLNTEANGFYSHSEGYYAEAIGQSSHAEGEQTIALNRNSHAQGKFNKGTSIETIHETGIGTNGVDRLNAFEIYGDGRVRAPEQTIALHDDIRSLTTKEYVDAQAGGVSYFIQSDNGYTTKYLQDTVPNGYKTATGAGAIDFSIIDGYNTQSGASGYGSFAIGYNTLASGNYSHAEGFSEGYDTPNTAGGKASHVEGKLTTASGDYSHAEGLGTIALNTHSHVQGRYNTGTSIETIHETGIGTNNTNRANAFEIYLDGRISMPNLPITDPQIEGMLWNDSGDLKISLGLPV